MSETNADHSELLSIAADIRKTLNVDDPTSAFYRRPDLAQAAEARLQATLIRAGAAAEPPRETPLQMAQREHDEAHTMLDMPAGQREMIDTRAGKLAELGAPKLKEMAAELRQEIGGAEYDRLVADARLSGVEVSAAILADPPLLKILAGRGAYLARYERTRPR